MPLPTARLAIESDYNRGLPTLVRWAHVAWAAIWRVVGPFHRWVHHPVRRYWAFPLVIAIAAFILGPMLFAGAIDLAIARALRSLVFGGDIRRELETLQQWGAAGSIVIASVVVWRMDPRRRLRLLDWLASLLVLIPVVTAMKMLIGRVRPGAGILVEGATTLEYASLRHPGTMIEYPGELLWPWGAWPLEGKGVVHAWEFWRGISSDLWSMPSSHTAYAVAMSVFIGLTYPRLRALAIVMAVIVGLSRVILNAHYPSDVVVGACIGYAIAWPCVRFRWGRRVLKGLRRRRTAGRR